MLKPEDVCERKNKKKRAVERERFLTSQRTQISHHLEYFYNTTLIKKREKCTDTCAFNKVTSDRTERLYERDEEKTRDKRGEKKKSV